MLRLDEQSSLLPAEDPCCGGAQGAALRGCPEQAEIKKGSKVDLMKLHKTNEVTGIQLQLFLLHKLHISCEWLWMERTISCVWSKRPEERNRLVSQSARPVPEYWGTKCHLWRCSSLKNCSFITTLCLLLNHKMKGNGQELWFFWMHTNSVPVFCAFFVTYYVPDMSGEMQNTLQRVPSLALLFSHKVDERLVILSGPLLLGNGGRGGGRKGKLGFSLF